MRSIAVVIQACPNPRPGLDSVLASIEASDIGTNYDLRFQPLGLTIREHFFDTMRSAATRGCDLVLRLEDDVLVNQHILHNLASWPAIDDPRFGAGWAFDPGGTTRSAYDRKSHCAVEKTRWVACLQAYSQAVLVWTRDVEAICTGAQKWFATHPSICEQDLAISSAVLGAGKQHAIHGPSLVEHLITLPSQLNHSHKGIQAATSDKAFSATWKRGDPQLDRFGRVVTARPQRTG